MHTEKGVGACAATTKAGSPCRAARLTHSQYCLAHADAKTRESTGFVANNGRQGRPPKPRAIDVYRERFEEERDEWWDVLVQARNAERAVVVGTGENATVEMVPDLRVRLAAFREVMDRVFGRPKQGVEVEDVTTRWDDKDLKEVEAYLAANDEGLARQIRAMRATRGE